MIITILIGLLFISLCFTFYFRATRNKFNIETEEKNKQVLEDYNNNKAELNILKEQKEKFNTELNNIIKDITEQKEKIQKLNLEYTALHSELKVLNQTEEEQKERISKFDEIYNKHAAARREELEKQTAAMEETSKNAFQNFCEILDNDYEKKNKEYNDLINQLKDSYNLMQMGLIEEAEKTKEDLEKLKATRASIIEAQRREREIQEDSSFYCLPLSTTEQGDIAVLESIKPKLNKPRILSMLIWSTYFQKPLKTLAANVLSTSSEVTGIYKITNTITGECYIGQAVDIAKRWAEHAKCGLGIDTPAKNKLYMAMQEYGLTSFSWEVLEKCSRDLLNEKEAYYIELYDSVSFGYNSQYGNK